MKGQYLLFEHGVLNVRRHRGYHVSVRTFDPATDGPSSTGRAGATGGVRAASSQMELFQ